MARYVKISTIGAPLNTVDETLSYDEALAHIEEALTRHIKPVLPDKPDLILLPEMCDVPTNYNVQRREEFLRHRGDRHIQFFANIAKENRCNIGFCTYRFGTGDYTLNTLYLLSRDGEIAGHYNKNHVVIPMESDQNVRCGAAAPIIQLDIGRVACAICFDLNFDVLRTHYKALKPEIILFASMFHGGVQQQIWAQSCRAYFVGAIANSRPSAILSPQGELLAYTTNYTRHVTATINLDYELVHLDYHQEKLAALKQKYGPDVDIFDPGNLGYVQVTSVNGDVSASQMVKEFEMTVLDDYLSNCLAAQSLPEYRGGESE